MVDDAPDTDAPSAPPPRIAVVVRDDLAVWQALNVTAFLVSGIGSRYADLIGDTQAIMRIVVVLPAPLGPRKPKTSPGCTSKSMPSTAT